MLAFIKIIPLIVMTLGRGSVSDIKIRKCFLNLLTLNIFWFLKSVIRIINTSKDKEISIFLKAASEQYQRVPELLVAQETVNLNQSNRYILSLGND